MLKISDLKFTASADEAALCKKASAILHTKVERCTVLRRSIDARKGVFFTYQIAVSLKNEQRVLQKCRSAQVSLYQPTTYRVPETNKTFPKPPIVVGSGPAGLFAALILAQSGAKPILLERGDAVEVRREKVQKFWRDGILDETSNVQFGEGGAGTFSDGKLNTGTKDIRHRFILEQFVRFGAPESILTDAKPHIGTDRLFTVLQNMRRHLLSLGAEIRFRHQLTGLECADGRVTAAKVTADGKTYREETDAVILALGHSARDTFALLRDLGFAMEQKPFAVGVRIEHRQADMDAAQYKNYAGHPSLPPTSYQLAYHTADGRGVFSFCVCPGGSVVAAASEKNRVVTNGMSEYARDGENINGGLLVSVTPEDFPSAGALAGVAFQRDLEDRAFSLGGGNYAAPAQTVGDFLAHRASTKGGKVEPSYRPAVRWCDLHDCLPDFICRALEEALPALGRKIKGFDSPDAVLTAVETRSSSPVRILRDETYQASWRGVFPCGEGAGYAGGIISAASDGIRCAEQIIIY